MDVVILEGAGEDLDSGAQFMNRAQPELAITFLDLLLSSPRSMPDTSPVALPVSLPWSLGQTHNLNAYLLAAF